MLQSQEQEHKQKSESQRGPESESGDFRPTGSGFGLKDK